MDQDPLTSALIALFRYPATALGIGGLLLAWAAFLIVRSRFVEHRVLVDAVERLFQILARPPGADKAATEARIAEIDGLFNTGRLALAPLSLGWNRFRRDLMIGDDGRLASTERAADAFDAVEGSSRSLEWWANIVLALGLTFTFLGLIAALAEATAVMSGDASGTQSALVGLLTVASTKFWTSVAGVAGSIALRWAAHRRRLEVDGVQAQLVEALDRWAPYINPAQLTVDLVERLDRLAAAIQARA